LDHSRIRGAVMQEEQEISEHFGSPDASDLTLADDDRAGARALYGASGGVRHSGGNMTGAADF
jgi:hypothetical protein